MPSNWFANFDVELPPPVCRCGETLHKAENKTPSGHVYAVFRCATCERQVLTMEQMKKKLEGNK